MDFLLLDSRVPGVGDLLQESEDIVKALKYNITKAKNQQKQYTDQKRTRVCAGSWCAKKWQCEKNRL